MSGIGKTLIILGLFLAALGAFLTILPKIPFLGKLPGDILVKKDNFTFYFPLTTSLAISALLSFILWIFSKRQ